MGKENPQIKCACGCGQLLSQYDRRGRERKYLPSHWSRLQPNQRESLPCDQCGKHLQRPQHHIKRVKHHFCNSECAGAWATQNGIRRGASNGHFNTITVLCNGCGQDVSKAESLIKRRNGQVYCPSCVGLVRQGRKGFYVGYPKEFSPSLRTYIRKRDNYICQVCGKAQSDAGTLHVHHIDYDKNNNAQSNLIALCRVCHGETNFGTDKWVAYFQGLISARITLLK